MYALCYPERARRLKNNSKRFLKMSLSELKILLDKFYDGTTSLKEENLLREFFTSDRVPSDMIADKEIFLSLSRSADNIVVPDNLKSSISDMIDQCEARDNEKNEQKGLKVYFRNHIHTLRNYSIAASVVILFGLALTDNYLIKSF